MQLVLLVLLYLVVTFGELLLWEQKDKTKMVVYGVSMLGALILGSLIILGLDIPSPATFIEQIIGVFITLEES